ncbi:hypothetical protein ACUN9V_04160 [Salinicola sp. V024]|uniref:hypothetical protein n=1 Tax=Salinicola sp. V024 TaxID=3459609 RepID=UPI0040451723
MAHGWLASSSFSSNPNHFNGVAYTEDSAILGTRGFNKYVQENGVESFLDGHRGGRFFAFLKHGKTAFAIVDSMGQDTLFYYSNGADWAISNSVLTLAEYLKSISVPLSLYVPAFLSLLTGQNSGVGSQLVSNNTPIAEIKVLPIGRRVEINDSGFSIKQDSDLIVASENSYRDLLVSSLADSVHQINSLRASGISIKADLSGGQDSRAVFGLLMHSCFNHKQKPRIVSNPRKKDDYVVAQSLAKYYGCDLYSNTGGARSGKLNDAYSAWKTANFCNYLPVYIPSSDEPDYSSIKANGATALVKNFARMSPLEHSYKLKEKAIDSDAAELIANEFLGSFDSLDVDREDPSAMDYFYLNFRSRFHYGRNWYASLMTPLFSPLMDPRLFRASMLTSLEKRRRGTLFMDILLAIDPILALHPYDQAEKAFSVSSISGSEFWGKSAGVNWKDVNEKPFLKVYAGAAVESRSDVPAKHSFVESAFVEKMRSDVEFYSKSSGLVNKYFGRKMIQTAVSELSSSKKLSDKTRLASQLIFCGMLDELISV